MRNQSSEGDIVNRYEYTVIIDGKRYPVIRRGDWYGGYWIFDYDREYGTLADLRKHVKELGGSVERKQNKDWKPKTTTKETP